MKLCFLLSFFVYLFIYLLTLRLLLYERVKKRVKESVERETFLFNRSPTSTFFVKLPFTIIVGQRQNSSTSFFTFCPLHGRVYSLNSRVNQSTLLSSFAPPPPLASPLPSGFYPRFPPSPMPPSRVSNRVRG